MNETEDRTGSQGGSGAPENNAPDLRNAGESAAAQNQSGYESQNQTRAAWTSQLSRELKDNPDTLKAVGGFKTINDLVEAFMKQNGGAVEKEAADAFEKALGEAAQGAEAKQPPAGQAETPDWKNEKAVKETVTKLVDEFGPAAAEFYRKALGHNKLGQVLDGAGLRSHPDIGRALVLLGREMSEEHTPGGKTGRTGSSPHTFAEGARLY